MKPVLVVFSFLALVFQVSAADNTQREAPKVRQEEVDQGMADINTALTEARAIPHFENGKPAGYRRVPAKATGQYEKLGLKNGDIVTAPDPDYVPPTDSAQSD
jgi:type II secretory pathway component PulC